MHRTLVACAALWWVAAVPAAWPEAPSEPGVLTVQDGRFVDAHGRQILLHGINVGGGYKGDNSVAAYTEEDFERVRSWGMNCVRLLISWAWVEPTCGVYDDAYLERVDRPIAWARANGLHVLIDMHQDLWGVNVPGGNGAPAWALPPNPPEHTHYGGPWAMAYFTSTLVHQAFDYFWANAPAPDGAGLQDHFAQAWRHVAERYADEPAVIGYDLLNEPFLGSDVKKVIFVVLPQVLRLLPRDTPPDSGGGFWDALQDPEAALKQLHTADAYRSLPDACGPLCQSFEREKLQGMYQRVAEAIRSVDTRHALFLEPSMFANVGVVTALEPVLGASGQPDQQQVFAPHVYDLVSETPYMHLASDERVALFFDRFRATVARLGTPLFVGEWGAFGGHPATRPHARSLLGQMVGSLANDCYWDYNRGLEERDYFEVIHRPHPHAIAGVLTRYALDPADKSFTCVWLERPEVTAPSRIYVGGPWYPAGFTVALEPEGDGYRFEPLAENAPNGFLLIAPCGEAQERRLLVRPR